jgi:hypothetical protein
MILADHLRDGSLDFPILGLETFETFIKICAEMSKWALDDMGLANRANVYKVWMCWIKPGEYDKLKGIVERYSSMKLLKHYLDINIVENNKIGLYIKLDYVSNQWRMSYGITNNKKLFMVGEFEYGFNTKLPKNQLLKYVLDEIQDFNPREHLALFRIKQDMATFDPGFCKRLDPQIVEKEIVVSTHGLGHWGEREILPGEAEKQLNVFKDWVKTQKWWDMVHLVVRPRKNKWLDFVIQLK